jgi:hypothetical protein
VPDRTFILQHPGNYTFQILGCQLPGDKITDLNKDGIPDIINTRATLNKMLSVLGNEYTLFIGSFKPIPFKTEINPKTNAPWPQL